MGNRDSSLASLLKNTDEKMKILMSGLDGSGKTNLLMTLGLGELSISIPLIGFIVEEVKYKDIQFVSWDVGGCDKIRTLWRPLYQNVTHFIMVIDSIDYDRILEVRQEIEWFISQNELQQVPVLLFANKQDLPNAMTVEYIIETLDLNTVLEDRMWTIIPSCVLKHTGLEEGFKWLITARLSNKAKSARF